MSANPNSGALSATACGACGKPVAYVNVNSTEGPPVMALKSAFNLTGPSHRDTCWPTSPEKENP